MVDVTGTVSILDAASGIVRGFFSTGRPLVSASAPHHVVPGLDGRLYQYSESGKLQILPMTVHDVLGHPVKTCSSTYPHTQKDQDDDNDPDNLYEQQCGIITGTKLTHLFALNPMSGHLEWTQQQPPLQHTEQNQNQFDATSPTLLLQREDFIVRHISTVTGQEVWNVTLGRFSALDFDKREAPAGYLPGFRDSATPAQPQDGSRTSSSSMLPSIAFGKDGKTLSAILECADNTRGHTLLWKRKWNAVVASVYGADKGGWTQLQVVDEPEELDQQTETGVLLLSSPPPINEKKEKEFYLDLLWHELHHMADMPTPTNNAIEVHSQPDFSFFRQFDSDFYQSKYHDCDETGVCTDTPRPTQPILLIGAGGESSTSTPEGLFLSWTMIARLLILAFVFIASLWIFYRRKKRHWLSQNSLSTKHGLASEQGADSRQFHPRASLTRSSSVPVLNEPLQESDMRDRLPPSSDQIGAKTHVRPGETVTTDTPSSIDAEVIPSTKAGVAHIDGIPLAQYSRYKSEFRELSPLGKGGFGTVFRCANALDGREYAIKKIHIRSEVDQNGNITKEFSQRLHRVLREVKILALLDHPNVVRYYTAWLELEEEGDSAHQIQDMMTNEYLTRDSNLTRCYSSELLTGISDDRRPPSSPWGGRRPINPLGTNGFLNDFDISHGSDSVPLQDTESDCGFIFERSEDHASAEDRNYRRQAGIKSATHREDVEAHNVCKESSSSEGGDTSSVLLKEKRETSSVNDRTTEQAQESRPKTTQRSTTPSSSWHREVRHTLYIQMQLCSQKTLWDFLADPEVRRGNTLSKDVSTIDIPCAVSLFCQVCQGVKHVHEQGLIHRDLKPQNCFIDEAGVVKVGDFGLSRESAASARGDKNNESEAIRDYLGRDEDNTSGVGTRSYASPEQIRGSDYDASTDIFSLALILFELCYPMYTGMERHIVFDRLRRRDFPREWLGGVAVSFPTVHNLLLNMLSPRPSDRPSAAIIARQMEGLLGQFTILSLDRKHYKDDGSVLLRVEAVAENGILPRTISLIQSSAPHVRILQYCLRGEDGKAVMEFALDVANDDSIVLTVLDSLRSTQDIQIARQVSDIRHF